MDPQFSAFYRQLYEKHWWFRTRERWLVEILQRHQPAEGWTPILDVGCGDALFFGQLSKFGEVDGVETSSEIVSPSNPYFHKIYIGPFESFQPRNPYSLVLLLDVLEHIPDPLEALRKCMSLLKAGGTLLLTVPAFNIVWTNHDVVNHHMTRYRKSVLFPILRQAGFTIEDSAYWFHWTFPVKFGERLIERALRLRPSNPAIPSPIINRALSSLCSLEHLILGPMRLPFGTTLFVRCTK